jgi:hypothetical protein
LTILHSSCESFGKEPNHFALLQFVGPSKIENVRCEYF